MDAATIAILFIALGTIGVMFYGVNKLSEAWSQMKGCQALKV